MGADSSGWLIPALVWSAAFDIRATATKVVETKLRGLWCCHPIADLSAVPVESLWDDWEAFAEECASRVGGYSMLGFKADDLAQLTVWSRRQTTSKVIQTLGISISMDTGLNGYWIIQSLAFNDGYDCRIGNGYPDSDSPPLSFIEVQTVNIRGLKSKNQSDIGAYQTKPNGTHHQKDQYLASHGFVGDDRLLFYARALIADSDHREKTFELGEYGPRLAIAISLLAEGTDPLARLDCYDATKSVKSGEHLRSHAISFSTKALVTELAASANVEMDDDLLSERGLAYATGSAGSKQLSYSPDEMAAASHMDEAIVISDDTLTVGTPIQRFETLRGGSNGVEKKVHVSDSVPLAAATPGAGDSACRGWICQVGFMLAILVAHATDNAPSGLVTIFLVTIRAGKPKVRAQMQTYFNVIYISFILNYIRFFSRGVSLSPRGQASAATANRAYVAVLDFVSVLPAGACTILSGWKWWVAFIPCMLSNLPGLLNTVSNGWDSAFEYKWCSWHLFNRWYAGGSYLRIEGLRKTVAKNVLSVNVDENNDPKVARQVLPFKRRGVRFMVIGG